eukprot:632409-Hanusia_phi.AAC.1
MNGRSVLLSPGLSMAHPGKGKSKFDKWINRIQQSSSSPSSPRSPRTPRRNSSPDGELPKDYINVIYARMKLSQSYH